ncbi:MAG: protein-glutamate O-methyltransferase CheR [Deltaproteobacteria bacterium]|nr:protein-glutamate O-methyltransferase CheR [Deltaproteobacteria bacterium]
MSRVSMFATQKQPDVSAFAVKPKMSGDVFVQLRDFIYERSGIFFAENKTYLLEDRISKRLVVHKFSRYEEYLYFLRYDPCAGDELKALYNSITTNETSFFRDMAQLDAFRKGIIPAIIARKTTGPRVLRIWSAGCSTGEEPYTLAMMAVEDGLLSTGCSVEIVATDLSAHVLESANKAVYGDYSTRNTSERILSKYFTRNGSGHEIKNDIKRMVRFEHLNLMDALKIRQMKGFDAVFCRNVLIYFNDDSKKKVVCSFYDALAEKGYLVLSTSESIISITRAFSPVGVDRCIFYQKK